MPFDGPDPQDAAVKVLRTIEQNFRTKRWKWIKCRYRRGKDGYCLLAAVYTTAFRMQPSILGTLHHPVLICLAKACGPRWPDVCSATVIVNFNDTKGRKLSEILAVIAKAQELARVGGV
jgi:hypothetical protein